MVPETALLSSHLCPDLLCDCRLPDQRLKSPGARLPPAAKTVVIITNWQRSCKDWEREGMRSFSRDLHVQRHQKGAAIPFIIIIAMVQLPDLNAR